jgi:hypothetical protein
MKRKHGEYSLELYIHSTKSQTRQRLRLVADTASTLHLGMHAQHCCMDPHDLQPAGSSRSWTADVHTIQQQRSARGCLTRAAAGSGDWSMQVAQQCCRQLQLQRASDAAGCGGGSSVIGEQA